MKGQQEVVSIIIISGILIGVVGSVYFWGVPLIQKNKDIATLDNSEAFVRNLNNKIKFVATNGGRDQMPITLPGIVKFTPDNSGTAEWDPEIELAVDTEGTIYATQAGIPLARNTECGVSGAGPPAGTFSVNEPETICVESSKVGEKDFRTSYTLKYIRLKRNDIVQDFQIKLTGASASGGERSTLVIENKGQESKPIVAGADAGRTLISTIIEVSIV